MFILEFPRVYLYISYIMKMATFLSSFHHSTVGKEINYKKWNKNRVWIEEKIKTKPHSLVGQTLNVI